MTRRARSGSFRHLHVQGIGPTGRRWGACLRYDKETRAFFDARPVGRCVAVPPEFRDPFYDDDPGGALPSSSFLKEGVAFTDRGASFRGYLDDGFYLDKWADKFTLSWEPV